MQTKELEELVLNFEEVKTQTDSLQKFAHINETDYRALPDELQAMITVGMGGAALKKKPKPKMPT